MLHHTTELRALGAVDYGANEIAAISDSEHAIAIRAIRVALESSLVTEFLSGVSIGLVAMVVGFALLGGRVSLEHALIAVLVTSEIFTHVRRFGVEFHRREDAERSLTLLDDGVTSPSGATTSLIDATDLVTAANERAFDVVLGPGQSLLVTGPSGSGKTTLLDTLLGWRDPTAGTVARTHAPIGHVSVESALLSGTLRDNLTLGGAMSDDDIRSRLSSLGLTGPRFDDLDTSLLADGRGLSTGEKVRVLLARALLARPALLVLDDVAGVLDDEARRRRARRARRRHRRRHRSDRRHGAPHEHHVPDRVDVVSADLRRLIRWLRRAQPPRGTLLRALAAGVVASLVNVALLVGAVGLFVESATRPGLRTVLGALIVIELFAFLRSPLRFVERLSAHRLGFAAVSRWRRWLVLTVGAFSFTRWRSFASGDLLERSLRDTDELQDLWLRCVIPLITSGVVMALGDLAIGLMAPHGRWWSYAGDLLAVQLVGVTTLLANVGALLRRDRVLRRARARHRAALVELSAAARNSSCSVEPTSPNGARPLRSTRCGRPSVR